ncbi:hypothetical protein [Paraburkholderia sp. BL23I1N1]|uniref:hypothetical protein n=1 Tax=Paraburkholderia sp. BL23I1N1 TaxID=1938802 RepID=UPI0015FFC598|nr:hypothetical protein [Paraburkholderia sp. BL23I1N1]
MKQHNRAFGGPLVESGGIRNQHQADTRTRAGNVPYWLTAIKVLSSLSIVD